MTKFRYEDKVKVTAGFFRECYGVVTNYEDEEYKVVINKNKEKKKLWHKAVWIDEKDLELDD